MTWNTRSGFRFLLVLMVGSMVLSCSAVKQVSVELNGITLNHWAMRAYMAEDYAKAEQLFEQALQSNQNNFIAAYNLACCHALQGDVENAAKYLTVSFANGYQDLEWMKQDTDFDQVRHERAFRSAVRKIEQKVKVKGEVKAI